MGVHLFNWERADADNQLPMTAVLVHQNLAAVMRTVMASLPSETLSKGLWSVVLGSLAKPALTEIPSSIWVLALIANFNSLYGRSISSQSHILEPPNHH